MEQDCREPQRADVQNHGRCFADLLALSAPNSVKAEKARFVDFAGRSTRETLALQPVSATAVGYHHTGTHTGVTLALPCKRPSRGE